MDAFLFDQGNHGFFIIFPAAQNYESKWLQQKI